MLRNLGKFDCLDTCVPSLVVFALRKFHFFFKHFAYPFVGTLLSGYIPEHAVAGRACSIFRGLVGCTTRAVFV